MGRPPRPRRADGPEVRHATELGRRRPRHGGVVYLSDNLTQSVLWAGKAQYDFEAPTVIVAVRVEGELDPDPHWQSAAYANSWLIHRGHISADDIVGFVEISPELLRAAVRREEIDIADHLPETSDRPSP